VNRPDAQVLARAGDTRKEAFLRLARPYARRRVARGLDGLWVSGLAEARAALAQRPLIFVANHVAWWDALLLLPLDDALGGTGWAVMDSRNLRSLPFLGWVGALPLDRSSPQRSRECLQSCADLLDRPGRGVWVFPQGRQRQPRQRRGQPAGRCGSPHGNEMGSRCGMLSHGQWTRLHRWQSGGELHFHQ
jgi:1-acyl-sn-glycerol-3-phosphate acyltransferase